MALFQPDRHTLHAFGSWCAAKMVGYIIQSKPKNIFNGGIDKVMMEEQPEDNDGDMTECLQN